VDDALQGRRGGQGAELKGEVALPSLAAGVVASLGGWMMDELLQPYLGLGFTLLLSLVGSTLIFYYVRRWLVELRGR
jgi:hypothetical protein